MNIQEVIAECEAEHDALVLPNKKNLTTTWYYRHGKVIAMQQGTNPMEYYIEDFDLTKCARDDYTDHNQYTILMEQFREKRRQIRNRFRQALFEYLGIENHPKRDTLYDMAEDRSTGSYNSIMETAEELVELL